MDARLSKLWPAACVAAVLLAPAPAAVAKEMTSPRHDTATVSSHFNLNKAVQRALGELGFDAGGVDGLWGSRSANALRAFQESRGLAATGRIDRATVEALGLLDPP